MYKIQDNGNCIKITNPQGEKQYWTYGSLSPRHDANEVVLRKVAGDATEEVLRVAADMISEPAGSAASIVDALAFFFYQCCGGQMIMPVMKAPYTEIIANGSEFSFVDSLGSLDGVDCTELLSRTYSMEVNGHTIPLLDDPATQSICGFDFSSYNDMAKFEGELIVRREITTCGGVSNLAEFTFKIATDGDSIVTEVDGISCIPCDKTIVYQDGVTLGVSAISNDLMNNVFSIKPTHAVAGIAGTGTVSASAMVLDDQGNIVFASQSVTLGLGNTLGSSLPNGIYLVRVEIINSYGFPIYFNKKIEVNGTTIIGEGYGATFSTSGVDAISTFTNYTVLDNGVQVNDPTKGSYTVYFDGLQIIAPATPVSGATIPNVSVGTHDLRVDWWFGAPNDANPNPELNSYKTSCLIVECL